MKPLNLPPAIAIPLAYALSPLVYAMFWWSKHVTGVDPKSGQVQYKYKSNGSVRSSKRAGIRYIFSKWKPYAYANHIGMRYRKPTDA